MSKAPWQELSGGSAADMTSQRKQEVGLDPGHSEKTGCSMFPGRDEKEQHEVGGGGQERSAWCI